MSNFLSPDQITKYTEEVGIKKANTGWFNSFMLAFMGGMFIALSALGSIIGTCTINNYSIASIVAGIIFSTGLMMVVIAGGALFTGNVLIIISVLQKKVSLISMVFNLIISFVGNLIGSLFIVFIVNYSGALEGAKGAILAKIFLKAVHKVEYPFMNAFLLGILCNILVCLAVWMMSSAKDTSGKVLACFFPIMLFILSGYEHIVANMFYIPSALLASINHEYIKLSGVSAHVISELTFDGLINNFIPVSLGNFVGGMIIGVAYSFIYTVNHIDLPIIRVLGKIRK